jgi:8-oxo-dGTP diphosphatase
MIFVRRRVAALIVRDGQLLVARQRARGPSGRHDGALYLTPPGGGIESGESPFDAVVREVREEVGLTVTSATFVARIDHPGGSTAVYETAVEEGDPVLGKDPELECDCPRLVGLQWVPAPPLAAWSGKNAARSLKVEISG